MASKNFKVGMKYISRSKT